MASQPPAPAQPSVSRPGPSAWRTQIGLAFCLGIATASLGQYAWRLWSTEFRPTEVTAEAARISALSTQLDLNLAEAAELRQLPGIGPVLAGRIIAEREKSGPFRSVDELARIPGLGERTLAEARPFLFVSRGASSRPAATSSPSGKAELFFGGEHGATASLDLNKASSHELQALPGIGPVLADRIVADRAANGPFKHIGDITRVKGIKHKTLEKIRPYLRVDEATTAHDARLGS